MSYLIDSNIFIYAGNATSDEENAYRFLTNLSSFYYAIEYSLNVIKRHLKRRSLGWAASLPIIFRLILWFVIDCYLEFRGHET